MFNSANILERLRNGETPEDIANEMTNALNKAQDELKAEKAKAAQEQEKEEKLNVLAERVAAAVNEYLEVAAGIDLTDEELAEMMVFAKKVAAAMKKAFPCRKIGVAVLGLEVPHAHIHLVPLQGEGDMDFKREKLHPTPEKFLEWQKRIVENL